MVPSMGSVQSALASARYRSMGCSLIFLLVLAREAFASSALRSATLGTSIVRARTFLTAMVSRDFRVARVRAPTARLLLPKTMAHWPFLGERPQNSSRNVASGPTSSLVAPGSPVD